MILSNRIIYFIILRKVPNYLLNILINWGYKHITGYIYQDKIDIVTFVAPNYFHYRVAKSFLEQGIYVICENPVSYVTGRMVFINT